jgi:hypothetical protein
MAIGYFLLRCSNGGKGSSRGRSVSGVMVLEVAPVGTGSGRHALLEVGQRRVDVDKIELESDQPSSSAYRVALS